MRFPAPLALLLLPLLVLAAAPPAVPEKVATLPQPTGYIDDYAGVLSAPAKTELEAIANEVHDKTRAQVFLVTVKTTGGEEVQTFANQLFAKWKIGEKKTDRGVLLLFAINDRKRWIEVGYGFEGILNDAKVGDIGRAMVPDLQAAHYDAAARLGLLDVSQVIAQDANVTLAESAPASGLAASSDATTDSPSSPSPDAPPVHHAPRWILFFIIPLFLCPFAGFFFLANLARRRGATFGGSSGSSGSSSSSSGGSSFGSDDSGGGDSFDGGDGGDSGGGGAGGGW